MKEDSNDEEYAFVEPTEEEVKKEIEVKMVALKEKAER